MNLRITLLLFFCSAAVPVACIAKEPAGNKLVLKEVSDIKEGKAAILQGTVDSTGDAFFVEHLSILQPVNVVLMAHDPSKPVDLSISKYRFNEPERTASTGTKGAVNFVFRTEGELKVVVKSPNEKRGYNLVIWAGDELKPDLTPPVKLLAPSSSGNSWLLAIIGLLLVGGALMFLKKKGARNE